MQSEKSAQKKSEAQEARTDLLGVFEIALDATRSAFHDGKISVWDYSEPSHFNSLWDSLKSGQVQNASRVLIIWNQTQIDPSLAPISTTEHVSPLHWAACAAGEVRDVVAMARHNVPMLVVTTSDALPAGGANSSYLAKDSKSNLYFRSFDAKAKLVVEWSEAGLLHDPKRLETIKQTLSDLWGKKELDANEKDRINDAVGLILGSRPPQVQVAILDLNPAAHQSDYLHVFCRGLDRHRLRWLRLLQAAELLGVLSPEGAFQPDTTLIDTEALKTRLFPRIEASRRNISPDLLRDRIRETLTSPASPDDRHAIANILGPIVLLKGAAIINSFGGQYCYAEAGERKQWSPDAAMPVEVKNSPPANHRSALNKIFRGINLLPQSSTDGLREKAELAKAQEDAKGQLAQTLAFLPKDVKLRVTLVDDQWHHGWYEWLKSMLPLDTAFTVCPDPRFLLNKVAAIKDRDTDLRFKFDLTPPATREDDRYADLLLLDLRLFSGNPTAEADFYKTLIPLCRKFEVAEAGAVVPLETPLAAGAFPRIRYLAWSGFGSKELECAQHWIAGGDGRTESNHRVCLTLLPRLLALTDLSLPIIIFSSTGQRSLVETFQHYANLVTSFQKPRFFSINEGPQAGAIASQFADAFAEAASLSKARMDLGAVCAARIPHEKLLKGKIPNFEHFELFFDESSTVENRNFRIGGLLVCYKNRSEADELQRLLGTQLRWSGPSQARLPKRIDQPRNTALGRVSSDGELWSKIAAKISQIKRERKFEFIIVPFEFRRPSPLTAIAPQQQTTGAWARRDLDNMVVEMLRLSVEALLAEILGRSLSASATIELYGATRERYVPLGKTILAGSRREARQACEQLAEFRETRQRWKDLWGFLNARAEADELKKGEYELYCAVRTFYPYSLYPLLTDVVNARKHFPKRAGLIKAIAKAICVYLTYGELSPEEELSWQHALVKYDQVGRENGFQRCIPPNRYCRTLHYVADYAMYVADRAPKQFEESRICEHRIDERCSGNLLLVLSAARWLDLGNPVSALLCFSLVEPNYTSEIGEAVREMVADTCRTLPGLSFCAFADLSRQQTTSTGFSQEVNLYSHLQ